ncbi:MAG: hypothetical protein ACYTJ0_07295 [Planctomycetota bacterium]|jgi:hypothetical protein
MRRRFVGMALVALGTAGPPAVGAQDLGPLPIVLPYRLEIIEVTGGLHPHARPMAMNNRGEVVGRVGHLPSTTYPYHAFHWHDGRFTELTIGTTTIDVEASAIDDAGVIAGVTYYMFPPWKQHEQAVRWIGGRAELLGYPKRAVRSRATLMDSNGLIFAWAWRPDNPSFTTHMCDGHRWIDLYVEPDRFSMPADVNDRGELLVYSARLGPVPPGQVRVEVLLLTYTPQGTVAVERIDLPADAAGSGLNNRGQIIGGMDFTGDSSTGFLWDDGELTLFDPLPGDDGTFILDINDAGLAVGHSYVWGESQNTAALFLDGATIDLNTLVLNGAGLHLHSARFINEKGQIAAIARLLPPEQGYRGVVLTPVLGNFE